MHMIKAIIFDFDGIILESTEIKTKAFRKLFEQEYPDKVDKIVDYHCNNMGISRYIKFGYIFENILHLPLSKELEEELGQRFSEIVFEEILTAPFVPGTVDFLTKNKSTYYMFIASGTPDEELQSIISYRRIGHLFREVHGSTKQKHEIIQNILNRYSITRGEVVFVGDAESDRIASEKTGVNFIARVTAENSKSIKDCQWKIKDLTELDHILARIR